MKRKRYTEAFKAKVALEAVKSQKTVNGIASEFGGQTIKLENSSYKKDIMMRRYGIHRT